MICVSLIAALCLQPFRVSYRRCVQMAHGDSRCSSVLVVCILCGVLDGASNMPIGYSPAGISRSFATISVSFFLPFSRAVVISCVYDEVAV